MSLQYLDDITKSLFSHLNFSDKVLEHESRTPYTFASLTHAIADR